MRADKLLKTLRSQPGVPPLRLSIPSIGMQARTRKLVGLQTPIAPIFSSRQMSSESKQKFYFKEYQQLPPTLGNSNSKLRTYIRGAISYALLTLGSALVTLYVIESNFPVSYPKTGSVDDLEIVRVIEDVANDLSVVKELRSQIHPDGRKVWQDWESLVKGRLRTEDSDSRTRANLSQTLKGTSRVALNWRWWDESGKRTCSLVHLGFAVSGWPRIVHGGMLATLLDEALGITAITSFPARTGVTANLKVKYLKPTRTEQFVIIKTRLVEATDRKALVKGEVLDLDGNVLVSSAGLFVVPKKLVLQPLLKDGNGAE